MCSDVEGDEAGFTSMTDPQSDRVEGESSAQLIYSALTSILFLFEAFSWIFRLFDD